MSGEEKAKVTCSVCNRECEAANEPGPDEPVYCEDCWEKRDPRKNQLRF